jgi:aryl-alcohol dehydrogenase-like predicted oxidoreductase
MSALNSWVANRQLAKAEVQRHSESAAMFWVGFPLSQGWCIQALVEAEDEEQAEQIARATIRKNWPQWKGAV